MYAAETGGASCPLYKLQHKLKERTNENKHALNAYLIRALQSVSGWHKMRVQHGSTVPPVGFLEYTKVAWSVAFHATVTREKEIQALRSSYITETMGSGGFGLAPERLNKKYYGLHSRGSIWVGDKRLCWSVVLTALAVGYGNLTVDTGIIKRKYSYTFN